MFLSSQVLSVTPLPEVVEVLFKEEETHREEKESRAEGTPEQDTGSTHQEEQTQQDHIEFLVREMIDLRGQIEGAKIYTRLKNCIKMT